jgi:hypothetical protein
MSHSRRHAIVLRYRRRYGRYERLGILVEPGALARARLECNGDADIREAARVKAHARTRRLDAAYVVAFASNIRAEFPAMPAGLESVIAKRACERGSRRVGRTARAKSFHRRAIFRAVCAHIRHRVTRYDALLASGTPIGRARKLVQPEIHKVLKRWTTTEHTSASHRDPAGSALM